MLSKLLHKSAVQQLRVGSAQTRYISSAINNMMKNASSKTTTISSPIAARHIDTLNKNILLSTPRRTFTQQQTQQNTTDEFSQEEKTPKQLLEEERRKERKEASRKFYPLACLLCIITAIFSNNDTTGPTFYKLFGLSYPPPRILGEYQSRDDNLDVEKTATTSSSSTIPSTISIDASSSTTSTASAVDSHDNPTSTDTTNTTTTTENVLRGLKNEVRKKLTPGKEHIEDPFCRNWDPSPWTWYELIKTTLMWTIIPIAPIRFFLIAPCVFGAWVFSKLSLLGLPTARQANKFTMLNPRSSLRRWVLTPALFFARLAVFLAGFMWVSTSGTLSPSSEVPIIVANHVTLSDALLMYSKRQCAPGFISKAEVVDVPLFGDILVAMGSLLLDRSNNNSRAEVQHEINRRALYNQGLALANSTGKSYELVNGGINSNSEIGFPYLRCIDGNNDDVIVPVKTISNNTNTVEENVSNGISLVIKPGDKEFHHVCVFPEGTTTSGLSVSNFKLGAFRPGVPVQPVVFKYPSYFYNPTYAGIDGLTCMFRILAQVYNRCEMQYLPPYYPSEQERQNPQLFADNVRDVMAHALRQPIANVMAY